MIKEIEQHMSGIYGAPQNDRFTAEFYFHEEYDSEHPTVIEAMKKATELAERRTLQRGTPVDPDYSISSLKRHGAEHHMKKAIWVMVKRVGAKDFVSYKATDEHKKQFPQAWEQFESKNNEQIRNLRERRQAVRIKNDRPKHQGQHIDWGSIGQPAQGYTVTFN